MPAIDSGLLDLTSHLDHVCEDGGNILETIIKIERNADSVRRLSGPQVMCLLNHLRNGEALALLLLAFARIEPATFASIQSSFSASSTDKVWIASYWGLVIEPISPGITEAGREKFWQDVYGGLLFLSQAPIDLQRGVAGNLRLRTIEDAQAIASLLSASKSSRPTVRNICALLLMPARANQEVIAEYRDLLARDESPAVRQTASVLLSGDASQETRACLREAIATDPDPQVRIQAIIAFANVADEGSDGYLASCLRATQTVAGQRAIVAGVAASKSPDCARFLATVVGGDLEMAVRADAIDALANRKNDALATSVVVGALYSGDWDIRTTAAISLGRMGDPSAIPPLERIAETDPSESVREHARESIKQLRR